uniref:Uncharacterized protein n=1 Tax=Cacopsylla melanoneura TaxID=428564 RepID=A0A8D8T2Z7_9HEMI
MLEGLPAVKYGVLQSYVTRLLKQLFDDTLAVRFSLTGRGGKLVFQRRKSYHIVRELCRKKYPDHMDKDFKDHLSNWFSQAKVRQSRAQLLLERQQEGENQLSPTRRTPGSPPFSAND